MAHNTGYYQQQPQQQQYTQVYSQSQPQNIYQQLGKPQPQPHLQKHPTYQQPQQGAYPFAQQQYGQQIQLAQAPYAPPHTPYQLSQTPHVSPQTPYPQTQTPYIPSQTPYTQSQTPYPVSQTPYAPSQTQYQQPQYPVQQQPQQVYSSHAQSQVSYVPKTSFASQTPAAVPTSSSGSTWRVPASRPPPVALSATLAQQAQAQAQVQLQPQAAPQTPTQTPARRPLPQPSPGANAKPPVLPFASPSADNASSGSNRPFPTQPIQTIVAPSSNPPSPTRSRPLPTPAGGTDKRNSVDLGNFPQGGSSSSLVSSAFSAKSSISSSTKRTSSPSKSSFPVSSSHNPVKKSEPVGPSITPSYATTQSSVSSASSSATPKGRISPPRFQSQPSSESSSPIKENAPALQWNKSPATTSSTISKSTPITSSSTTTANSTSDTSAPPPKKFTPIWRRTVPDYPAPAWGYAAGMVSEPYPKPEAQVPPPAVAPPVKGKLKKKQEETVASPPVSAVSKGAAQYQQYPASHYQQSGQPGSTSFAQPAVQQRHTYQQQQQQAYYGHTRTPAGYAAESQDEDDEDGEEDSEEETDSDEEDEEEPDPRYNPQNQRQVYTRPKAGVVNKQRRPLGRERAFSVDDKIMKRRTGEDDRELRLAYDDDDDEEEEEEEEEEEVRVRVRRQGVKNGISREAPQREHSQGQLRGQGASPQWGIPANRRAGSSGTRYRAKYDDEEEEEEEEEDLRYRHVRKKEKEWDRSPKSQSTNRRFRETGSGSGTGLPQPPAMVREIAGGAKMPKKSAKGGPKQKSTPIKYDDYDREDEDGDVGGRRKSEMQYHQQEGKTRKFAVREMGDRTRPMKGGSKYDDYEPDDGGEAVRGRRKLEMQYDHQQAGMTRKFVALGMNDRTRSIDNQGSAGGWPADLPRLPRTPGSSSASGSVTNDGGGYFDIQPQPVTVASPASEFSARQQLRSAGISGKMNISLDDPPPPATVIRSPSPGPPVLISRPRHPESQTYGGSAADDRMEGRPQRRRSLYSAPGTVVHTREEEKLRKRPQSQIYGSATTQMQAHIGSHDRQQHQFSSQPPFPNQIKPMSFNTVHYPSQTPAPPPTIGIESPHPVGGRDKFADIPKLEEGSNDEGEGEHRQRHNHRRVQHVVPRINVASDPSPPPPPRIQVDGVGSGPSVPRINVDPSPRMNTNGGAPIINIEPPRINVDDGDSPRKQYREVDNSPRVQVYEVPGISVSGSEYGDGPSINVSGPDDRNHPHSHRHTQSASQQSQYGGQARPGGGGFVCGGCNGSIIGRVVSAMGSRWHSACFRCTVCNELLEHVSSYEHEGRPYCHLDYHENFAPKCYSCKTAIIEEQFISLDDPALGKRTYHTQHFFCAECGDPFLSPSVSFPDSKGEVALSGDGEFEGFTVYKGHPYCEACHVRLRLPKCKRCKRSIRDRDEAVEALGGKWCWGCFVCASCNKPFEDPSFFQRDDKPFCERCFSIMLRNEV